ncbi:AcrR Transcriptional regulator [Burkholderiaceae bacterium]
MTIKKNPSNGGTREKILKAASRLFADQGFDGCSLREIADHAKVNVGMIHYFFGSKQMLLREAFVQAGASLALKRIELLDNAEAAAGDSLLSVDTIVEMFLRPAVDLARTGRAGRAFLKMQARMQLEQSKQGREFRSELYDASSRRYVNALKQALPTISDEKIYWRFIFMLGTYQYVLANTGRLEVISENSCSSDNHDVALLEMVTFLSAGFKGNQS